MTDRPISRLLNRLPRKRIQHTHKRVEALLVAQTRLLVRGVLYRLGHGAHAIRHFDQHALERQDQLTCNLVLYPDARLAEDVGGIASHAGEKVVADAEELCG